MNDLSALLYNVRCFFGVVFQLLWYGVRLCWDLLLPTAVARERAGEAMALMGRTSNLEVIQKGTPEGIRRG